jgi:hypothetical protein
MFVSCSSHAKTSLTSKDLQHINLINGYASECMMDEFFLYQNNWQKIEGERGSNGIDGLYIKNNQEHITDVLVVESKYNHSRLGSIKKGTIKQMSKEWILKKLHIAKPYNPDIKNFDEIILHVTADDYRARLFHLKPLKEEKLKITLFDIKNQSNNRSITKIKTNTIIIDFQNPKNSFHTDMIESYNRCRREFLERYFNNLSPSKIEALLQKSAISREDLDRGGSRKY